MRFRLTLCILFFHFIASAQKLVMPGDYPDPSVVKIGDTYWATATTSNWFPAYPLLKSKDLINWTQVNNVFNKMPDWVDYYFWAPEISYENGKVYIYYSAHKKGGNLCLGIASADKPEGPYKDHGPLMCQPVGSIDAFPMRDEKGKLHLVWKEDANSVGKPTPIWIQEMNEERTALIGEKKELFRNDQPWEGNLVEGVSMMRHGDYIYAFYAAAACCGRECTYKSGVARAKSLLGPWEKYNRNPVLTDKGNWKCPGHGTPVEKEGRYYFLYHAYDTAGNVYTGRQGLLQEFRFTNDGWIEFIEEAASPVNNMADIKDKFKGNNLSLKWQWSVFQDVQKEQKRGRLHLNAIATPTGAFLGQKTLSLNYDADAIIHRKKSTAGVGLSLIGDERNSIYAIVEGDSIKVIEVRDNKEATIASLLLPEKKKIEMRMEVRNGKDVSFLYRKGGTLVPVNKVPVNGSFLPPWDRALRAGVVAKGANNQVGVFNSFRINNLP